MLRIDIRLRIFQRIADAGLRGEVHDAIGTFALEYVRQARLVR